MKAIHNREVVCVSLKVLFTLHRVRLMVFLMRCI